MGCCLMDLCEWNKCSTLTGEAAVEIINRRSGRNRCSDMTNDAASQHVIERMINNRRSINDNWESKKQLLNNPDKPLMNAEANHDIKKFIRPSPAVSHMFGTPFIMCQCCIDSTDSAGITGGMHLVTGITDVVASDCSFKNNIGDKLGGVYCSIELDTFSLVDKPKETISSLHKSSFTELQNCFPCSSILPNSVSAPNLPTLFMFCCFHNNSARNIMCTDFFLVEDFETAENSPFVYCTSSSEQQRTGISYKSRLVYTDWLPDGLMAAFVGEIENADDSENCGESERQACRTMQSAVRRLLFDGHPVVYVLEKAYLDQETFAEKSEYIAICGILKGAEEIDLYKNRVVEHLAEIEQELNADHTKDYIVNADQDFYKEYNSDLIRPILTVKPFYQQSIFIQKSGEALFSDVDICLPPGNLPIFSVQMNDETNVPTLKLSKMKIGASNSLNSLSTAMESSAPIAEVIQGNLYLNKIVVDKLQFSKTAFSIQNSDGLYESNLNIMNCSFSHITSASSSCIIQTDAPLLFVCIQTSFSFCAASEHQTGGALSVNAVDCNIIVKSCSATKCGVGKRPTALTNEVTNGKTKGGWFYWDVSGATSDFPLTMVDVAFKENFAECGKDIFFLINIPIEEVQSIHLSVSSMDSETVDDNSIVYATLNEPEKVMNLVPLIVRLRSDKIYTTEKGEDKASCGSRDSPCSDISIASEKLPVYMRQELETPLSEIVILNESVQYLSINFFHTHIHPDEDEPNSLSFSATKPAEYKINCMFLPPKPAIRTNELVTFSSLNIKFSGYSSSLPTFISADTGLLKLKQVNFTVQSFIPDVRFTGSLILIALASVSIQDCQFTDLKICDNFIAVMPHDVEEEYWKGIVQASANGEANELESSSVDPFIQTRKEQNDSKRVLSQNNNKNTQNTFTEEQRMHSFYSSKLTLPQNNTKLIIHLENTSLKNVIMVNYPIFAALIPTPSPTLPPSILLELVSSSIVNCSTESTSEALLAKNIPSITNYFSLKMKDTNISSCKALNSDGAAMRLYNANVEITGSCFKELNTTDSNSFPQKPTTNETYSHSSVLSPYYPSLTLHKSSHVHLTQQQTSVCDWDESLILLFICHTTITHTSFIHSQAGGIQQKGGLLHIVSSSFDTVATGGIDGFPSLRKHAKCSRIQVQKKTFSDETSIINQKKIERTESERTILEEENDTEEDAEVNGKIIIDGITIDGRDGANMNESLWIKNQHCVVEGKAMENKLSSYFMPSLTGAKIIENNSKKRFLDFLLFGKKASDLEGLDETYVASESDAMVIFTGKQLLMCDLTFDVITDKGRLLAASLPLITSINEFQCIGSIPHQFLTPVTTSFQEPISGANGKEPFRIKNENQDNENASGPKEDEGVCVRIALNEKNLKGEIIRLWESQSVMIQAKGNGKKSKMTTAQLIVSIVVPIVSVLVAVGILILLCVMRSRRVRTEYTTTATEEQTSYGSYDTYEETDSKEQNINYSESTQKTRSNKSSPFTEKSQFLNQAQGLVRLVQYSTFDSLNTPRKDRKRLGLQIDQGPKAMSPVMHNRWNNSDDYLSINSSYEKVKGSSYEEYYSYETEESEELGQSPYSIERTFSNESAFRGDMSPSAMLARKRKLARKREQHRLMNMPSMSENDDSYSYWCDSVDEELEEIALFIEKDIQIPNFEE
ncbi:uncharacterized protein MONOS_1660 [Monocercomonoides exilis]|uniref:uncharacterized protein n=1 Tax=Monocercomonoides exilis TaxID=2049356 RepID=UPI00355ACA3B|nr:hypothetical protein MONOS_1660 [Monocercomonoides exilis]|eukprot:MONOS_1660.1-p1 / transcript=MONOS_1660.1 / gene=MONOS_1660 / organism=Monocercomonoides_exilis_PA203 / gene_product=unspecified product / transcript_product=unspecified product / location=Mono_scaffold00030:168797-173917(-) / protein_length=1673 / sequence_SO=supercontig / SO=protein_coding / is_pseudo=false